MVCTFSKNSVTKFTVRMSVPCTAAFVNSNFVTECLPKVGIFISRNNRELLDLEKSGLKCGSWINGYDYLKKSSLSFQKKKETILSMQCEICFACS